MDLSGIHFHDTRILRVIEDPATDTLTMSVSYPVDWEQNRFEPRRLVFVDSHNYQVFEIPFAGCPAILDAEVISTDGRWSRVRLETNAGYREISCETVTLALDSDDA